MATRNQLEYQTIAERFTAFTERHPAIVGGAFFSLVTVVVPTLERML